MPVILQAGWPPINATSSFINSTNLSGGKGHSWSRWWDKIRLRRKEMGVKVRLQLAYHSLVNVRKVTDLINHLIEDNVLPQSWTINEDELIWKYRESFYRTCTFLLHTIWRLQYFWSIFTGSPAAPLCDILDLVLDLIRLVPPQKALSSTWRLKDWPSERRACNFSEKFKFL